MRAVGIIFIQGTAWDIYWRGRFSKLQSSNNKPQKIIFNNQTRLSVGKFQYSMLNVQCSMSNAQCSMLNIQYSRLNVKNKCDSCNAA